MNKYTIIGVIALMTISLLGVVGLQLYWINDAIRVKQSQFDHAVNSALTSAVDKLETQEAVSVVTEQITGWQQPLSADTVKAPASIPEKTAKPAIVKNRDKPVTAQPKPSPTPKPVKHPPKPANTIVWVKDGIPPMQGTLIKDKKGRNRVVLASGDTVTIRGAQATGAEIRFTEKLPDTHFPPETIVQLYTEAKEAARILQKDPVLQKLRFTDTLHTRVRSHSTTIRFSVDTLRLLATKLDSLHHFTRFSAPLKPTDLEAVRVRNDSVFTYQKGSTKPVYVSHTRQPVVRPVPVHGRQGAVPFGIQAHDAAAMQEANKTYRISTTEKKAGKQTKNKAEQKQQNTDKTAPAPQPKPEKTATEKLETKKEKLNDVVQKMVVEYVAKDVPLQQRLNLQQLPTLLQEELQKQGITLPFGYHVVSGQKDTLVVKNIPKPAEDLHYYAAALFPNDIIEKQDYLGVYFPDSKTYAVKSLWGMLALSGFFTLVIIATFGTTIHIIYKQKKLSEMKNDFINNMTHEFKTPIATISLATDSIANPKVFENPEKIQYYTNIIRQENKRMNAQVENVLQIALLEKNEFKMKLQPVDVHLLIVKAIESIRLQIEQRMGKINIQLDALKHELHSDEVHLFNAICNLLDNANKYSPAAPEISLSTQNVDGGILIAVDDKGMGMTKDTQQRVFEKFYRVPTGNLHNVKGFGLGLSYVKAIVQAHHGQIRLWSEPGKGSRFEIFLPLRQES